MIKVLRQPNFAFFWFGQLVSLIGDALLFVALPFYIYTLTGSTLAIGIMLIVQTIPNLVLSSFAGVFVDRWNRKYMLIASNLIQAGVLLPLLLIHSKDMIWIVYVFAFIASCVSQFTIASSSALIPNLVEEQDLLAANSLNSVGMELMRLVGPFLGGLLMALLGIDSVILVDSFSFLCIAVLLCFIKVPATLECNGAAEQTQHTGVKKVWHEWLAGMKLVTQHQLISAIFISLGVAMIAEGILQVILAPWVKTVLHGTPLTFGYISSAQAVGGICGSILMPIVSRIVKPQLLIPLCGMLVGILVFNIVCFPILWLDLVLVGILGLCVIGFFVNLFTLLQGSISDAYRGRVIGAFGTLQAVMMLIGMVLASAIGDRLGSNALMGIGSIWYFLAGVASILVVRRMKFAQLTQNQEVEQVALAETVQEPSVIL